MRASLFGRQEKLSPKQDFLSPKPWRAHPSSALGIAFSLLVLRLRRFTLSGAKFTLLAECAKNRACDLFNSAVCRNFAVFDGRARPPCGFAASPPVREKDKGVPIRLGGLRLYPHT